MAAFAASEMLAQAYSDWTKAVRADDHDALVRAAAESKANGGPDYVDVLTARKTCTGESCVPGLGLCAWHFWRWWTRPGRSKALMSDCIHCGEPLEFVNDYGLRGWSSTDQQDMDNNGMHCLVTDDVHTPYSIDLQAVPA